jgi:hypothetical protein
MDQYIVRCKISTFAVSSYDGCQYWSTRYPCTAYCLYSALAQHTVYTPPLHSTLSILTANVEILHLTIWLTLRYILVHFIIFLNDLPFSYQKGVPKASKYTLQETKIILFLFWTRQISKFSSNFTNISGKMLGQVFFL